LPETRRIWEIGGATTAASVNFQMTDREAPVSKGKDAEKTHHDAEHKRDGVL
jgi:hypothetical protein